MGGERVETPVAVIGLGRFGSALALELQSLGHEVLGIDTNAELVQQFAPLLTRTVTADSTGAWSANLLGQAAGVHSYVARQLNADGSTTDSAATTITIDTTAPTAPSTPSLTVASNSGSSSDTVTNITTPTLSGTAAANAGVTVLQDGSSLGKVQAGADGTWTFTVPRAVADGSYSYTARQEDAAGNLSAASSALSVTLQCKRPYY